MPVLRLETFVSPDDLFAREKQTMGDDSQWWVLHTRPRTEKALARALLRRGASFFLPLYERKRRSQGRALRSYLPLFPGYLFVYEPGQDGLTARERSLVARVLPVGDQGRLHADLSRVHRVMLSKLPLRPEKRLESGTLVEILGGPLAGMTGKIARHGSRLNLMIEVQLLQCGVSVEIENSMIRPLANLQPR
jgi:transcriptional antiterminator RfaH